MGWIIRSYRVSSRGDKLRQILPCERICSRDRGLRSEQQVSADSLGTVQRI
jgi:hypothetical protein